MIAAPMFHSWGFVHFTLGMSLSSTLVLNRKFDPEATLSLTAQHECTRADRRAGDDAADPRAARRDARALRPVEGARGGGLRLGAAGRRCRTAGWTCSATTSTTSTARPRSRGRASPRRPTCAPRPAPPAARRTARSSSSTARTASRSPAGRDRPHLRRQRDAVRGLHRRRQQGRDRRADVVRRRRPLRRGGPPVRRRPRRRHDRLRRRERLPGRGRGPARRARRGRSRWRCSASTTRSSASA